MPGKVAVPAVGGPADVDLWVALTTACAPEALREHFGWALSDEEWARHARFARIADAHVFLLSRALLRVALANAIGGDPGSIGIVASASGKPRVTGPVEFNLSHTVEQDGAGAVAVAVTTANPVGVDIEPVSRGVDLAELVARRYTLEEQAMLARCDPAARHRRMVWMWTAKEAVLKATGEGLRRPPETVALEWGADDRLRTPGWHLTRFARGGFVGTVATAGTPGVTRVRWRAGGDLGEGPAPGVELRA